MGCGASTAQPLESNVVVSPVEAASIPEIRDRSDSKKPEERQAPLVTSYQVVLQCYYKAHSLDGNHYPSDANIEIPLFNYLTHAFPSAIGSLHFDKLEVPEFRIILTKLNDVPLHVVLREDDAPLSLEEFDKNFVYDVGHKMRKLARRLSSDEWSPPISASALHRLFAQTVAVTLLEEYVFDEHDRVPLTHKDDDTGKKKSKKQKDVPEDQPLPLPCSKRGRVLAFLEEAGFKISAKDELKQLSLVHRAVEAITDAVSFYIGDGSVEDDVTASEAAAGDPEDDAAAPADVSDDFGCYEAIASSEERKDSSDGAAPESAASAAPTAAAKQPSAASTSSGEEEVGVCPSDEPAPFPVRSFAFPVYRSRFIPFPTSRKGEHVERAQLTDYLPAAAPPTSVFAGGLHVDEHGHTYTVLNHPVPPPNPQAHVGTPARAPPVCEASSESFCAPLPVAVSVNVSADMGFDIFQHLGVRPLIVSAAHPVDAAPVDTDAGAQLFPTPLTAAVVPQYRATAADLQGLHFLFLVCLATCFSLPTLPSVLAGTDAQDTLSLITFFQKWTHGTPRLTPALAEDLIATRMVKGRAADAGLRTLLARAGSAGISPGAVHTWWPSVAEGLDVRAWTHRDFHAVGAKKAQAGRLLAAGWSRACIRFCAWLYSQLDADNSGTVEEHDIALLAERVAAEESLTVFEGMQKYCSYHHVYPFPTSRLLHIDPQRRISFDAWLYFVAVTCSSRPANLVNLSHSILRLFSLPAFCRVTRPKLLRDRRERAVLLYFLAQRGLLTATRGSGPQLSSSFAPSETPETALESNVICVRADEWTTADQFPAHLANIERLEAEARKAANLRATRSGQQGDKDAIRAADLAPNGRIKVYLADWERYLKASGFLDVHSDESKRQTVDKYWGQVARLHGV